MSSLEELVVIVDRLLGPGGCPWDQAQTHESLKRHLIEEAYEVIEAIDENSTEKLKEELGDLLLQPIMHAQMACRDGRFCSEDVAKGIVEKLVRRHPHVFGEIDVTTAEEVLQNWDEIKKQEKGASQSQSVLAGVPRAMPALLRAYEISKRAARSGFEWPDEEAVFDKLREEERELREAISSGNERDIEAELGDMLFTIVNIARWRKIEPEDALRKMLDRFTERFQHMEAASTRPLKELSPAEWDDLWNSAKFATKS
jgi:tetrapyrrole methylase family protein / MazG family protein